MLPPAFSSPVRRGRQVLRPVQEPRTLHHPRPPPPPSSRIDPRKNTEQAALQPARGRQADRRPARPALLPCQTASGLRTHTRRKRGTRRKPGPGPECDAAPAPDSAAAANTGAQRSQDGTPPADEQREAGPFAFVNESQLLPLSRLAC
jgi:hypothetical protein